MIKDCSQTFFFLLDGGSDTCFSRYIRETDINNSGIRCLLLIHSWRGAMIEADQATEPPPSANEKEAAVPPAPANPAGTVPLEGQHCLL